MLLDVYLPDMSGLEVLQRLRARPGRPVDVIAITAARELETVRTAMAGGVLHYLVKPFTAQVLRERLDDYLRHQAEIRRTEARETPTRSPISCAEPACSASASRTASMVALERPLGSVAADCPRRGVASNLSTWSWSRSVSRASVRRISARCRR